MKTAVIFVYGVCTALVLAGTIWYIFTGKGGGLICLTLAATAAFQGWVIHKLFKQTNNQE